MQDASTRITIRNVLQHSVGLVTGRISYILLSMLATVLIARLLGPDQRGVLALYASVWILGTQFLNFGLQKTAIFMAARGATSRRMLRSFLRFWITILFIGAIPAGFIVTQILPVGGLRGLLYGCLATLIVPVSIAQIGWFGVLNGLHRYRAAAIVVSVSPIPGLLLLLGSYFILGGISFEIAMLYTLITSLFSLVLCRKVAGDALPKYRRWAIKPSTLRVLLTRSGLAWMSQFVSAASVRLTVLIAGWQAVDSSLIGSYAVGLVIADASRLLMNQINGVYLSKISRRGTDMAAPHRPVLLLLVLLVFASLASIWAGPPFVDLVFGAAYAETASYLPWLLLGTSFWFAGNVYLSWMFATAPSHLMLVAPWTSSGLFVLGALFLMPEFGITVLVIGYVLMGACLCLGNALAATVIGRRLRSNDVL